MEVTLTEQTQTTPITSNQQTEPPKKSGRGGARPNTGGARPGAGRKKGPDHKTIPEKWKLVDEADLPEARRKLLVLPPIPSARNNRPQELLKWWTALTEDQLSHLAIYVYRLWPMIRAKQVGPNEQSNIKIMTGPCPFSADSWELDIMREFGSGDYRFSINEDSVHRADVYIKTTRDLERYPPMLDYRMLAVDDPSNKEYIAWARMRGLLEGIGLHNEENDMASAAVEQLASANERMADRMMDLADRVAEKGTTSSDSRTESKLVEMVIDASTRANNAALDMVKQSAGAQQQLTNPLELLDRFIALINKGGGNSEDSAILSLMTRMLETAEKRADVLAAEMRDMRNSRRNSEDDDDDLPKGLGKLTNTVNALAELGLVKKNSSSAEQEDATAIARSSSMKDQLITMAINKLPEMLGAGGLNGLLGNLAQIIAATRMAPAVAGATPLAGATAQPAIAAATPAPPPPVMLNGFPMPNITGLKDLDDIHMLVWRIAPTILHHMNADTLNGYTFARWLIDSTPDGRQMYDQMKEAETAAPGTVKSAMLEGYKPLWDIIGKTPAKVDKFLTEILRLDDWEKEQDELDDAGDDDDDPPATPVTGAVLKS